MWKSKTIAHIREKCNVEDVVWWARKRRWGWNGHVTRMEDDTMAKIARSSKPQLAVNITGADLTY